MKHQNDYVIIMAGGVGTRFWPMSRKTFPKQFHDILGTGRSLIQETYDRFHSFIPSRNIYVVTNDSYFELVKEQLPALSDDQILLEPVGRNTAPCVAYAAYKINKINPEASFVVAPADHLIAKRDVFQAKIELGLAAVDERPIIMTLGIKPTRPDTGYGYIQFVEDKMDNGYFRVNTFTEKPKLPLAEKFCESGDYLWNGGIFLFKGTTILKAFQDYMPDTAELFSEIADAYYTDQEEEAIARTYSICKPESMDYGIMEKADKDNIVYTIPADLGWSDLGTWGSVHANSPKDDAENTIRGNVIVYDANNNIIQAANGKKVIIAKGVDDLIVIDTDDALLVCKKEDEQFIKKIVGDLKVRFADQYV